MYFIFRSLTFSQDLSAKSHNEQKLFLIVKILKVATSCSPTATMGKMKDSSLLKWTQNNKNNMLSGGKERKKTKEEKNKNWLHSPERLTSGHIAYLVKVIFICPKATES